MTGRDSSSRAWFSRRLCCAWPLARPRVRAVATGYPAYMTPLVTVAARAAVVRRAARPACIGADRLRGTTRMTFR